jgi:endonuclease YncB( thermonuclease family)
MTRLLLPLLLSLLALPFPASAKEPIRTLYGVVVKVADGDTVTVNTEEGTKVKVRLYGIDAPETEKGNRRTGRVSKPGQPYGEEAYRAISEKVMGQRVRLDIMDIDRYRRAVSVIWLDKRNINLEMVKDGWAWAYRQYLSRPYASVYMGAEERARSERRGLWQQNNPQPPWEFRRMLRRK